MKPIPGEFQNTQHHNTLFQIRNSQARLEWVLTKVHLVGERCCFPTIADLMFHSPMEGFEYGDEMAWDMRTIVWNRSTDLDQAASLYGEEFLSSKKTGPIIIHDTMTAHRYCNAIILHFVIPNFKNTGICQTFSMKVAGTTMFQHPSFACINPDLNPIEHVWDMFGKTIASRQLNDINELNIALTECWNRLPREKSRAWLDRRKDDLRRNKMQKVVTLDKIIDGYLPCRA